MHSSTQPLRNRDVGSGNIAFFFFFFFFFFQPGNGNVPHFPSESVMAARHRLGGTGPCIFIKRRGRQSNVPARPDRPHKLPTRPPPPRARVNGPKLASRKPQPSGPIVLAFNAR
ncbi:hypothetical protein GGR53DRAFT_164703 [Hypoxylon sp. FL1150]|nr:hypothetical protein GGR53DRAFT_164703 [Hypoxylon sp. FL1150]